MKILVSSLYFQPDHSGIALYSTDLATYFTEQGHEVTVVTGFSFYPRWQKRPEDEGRLLAREQYQGMTLLRGYMFVPAPGSASAFKRILHDLSFILFAMINFMRAGRQDCIVVLTPPSLLGVIGVFFKWLWGAQLVTHIQDMQADAAQALGMVKGGGLVRGLAWLENWSYRHSTWVATITQGMWERLYAKGLKPDKLDIFYNWIDVQMAVEAGEAGWFRQAHPAIADKFLVAYAGNIGVKQGLDVMVSAAEVLHDDPRIHFVLIGEGADRPRIAQLIEEKQLENLTLMSFLDGDGYYSMLEDVNALLVAQRTNTGNVFFPSKLLGIMAKGRPLLVAADLDSELAQVIAEVGCGLVSPAEDAAGLASNIYRLLGSPALRRELGCRGRREVQAYDRSSVLAGFLARIQRGGTPKPEVLEHQLEALAARQQSKATPVCPELEHA